MKLIGESLIELKDVRTGKREYYRDKNMVTSSLNYLFSVNINGMNNYRSSLFYSSFLPICPNAIGGILMFEDPLVENTENIFAPSTLGCTGYASNDVNTTTDVKRGSLNQTESMALDNGYKFVWDFSTSQGNGTIASLALTSKHAGKCYWGSIFDNGYVDSSNPYGRRFILNQRDSMSWDYSKYNEGQIYISTIEVDFENGILTSIYIDSSYNIIVRKTKKHLMTAGLTSNLKFDGKLIETHSISAASFKSLTTNVAFFDGKDGYWYGFGVSSYASSQSKLKWVKIKKSDYSFTEGEATLSNVYLSYSTGSINTFPSGTYYYTGLSKYCCLRNGYLYMPKNDDSTKIYKININNYADVTQIQLGFGTAYSGNNYKGIYFYEFNGIIFFSNGYIDENDKVTQTYNYSYELEYTSSPLFAYKNHAITFGGYSAYSSSCIYINEYEVSPYLATINNLSSAVVKTADKTMKITYTLTEAT